jgi:hypothetical protein
MQNADTLNFNISFTVDFLTSSLRGLFFLCGSSLLSLGLLFSGSKLLCLFLCRNVRDRNGVSTSWLKDLLH